MKSISSCLLLAMLLLMGGCGTDDLPDVEVATLPDLPFEGKLPTQVDESRVFGSGVQSVYRTYAYTFDEEYRFSNIHWESYSGADSSWLYSEDIDYSYGEDSMLVLVHDGNSRLLSRYIVRFDDAGRIVYASRDFSANYFVESTYTYEPVSGRLSSIRQERRNNVSASWTIQKIVVDFTYVSDDQVRAVTTDSAVYVADEVVTVEIYDFSDRQVNQPLGILRLKHQFAPYEAIPPFVEAPRPVGNFVEGYTLRDPIGILLSQQSYDIEYDEMDRVSYHETQDLSDPTLPPVSAAVQINVTYGLLF